MKRASWRRSASSFWILAVLAWGGAAYAKSSNNVMNLPNSAAETTDRLAVVFSPSGPAFAAGIVTVNNGSKIADNRSFVVVFTLTNPGQQGGLSFRLVNAATGADLSLTGSPGNASQALAGSFASGTAADTNLVYRIEARVDPSKVPAPGTYTAVITEHLYAGSTVPPGGSLLDSNTLTVRVTVGAYYDVSVVAAGADFSVSSTSQALSFGLLSSGKQVAADLIVRSNVAYSLTLTSANRSVLVNPDDPGSSVAYAATANGAAADLAGGTASVAIGAPAAYENPARYALAFTILPIADNPSTGIYADTVTVNLAAP